MSFFCNPNCTKNTTLKSSPNFIIPIIGTFCSLNEMQRWFRLMKKKTLLFSNYHSQNVFVNTRHNGKCSTVENSLQLIDDIGSEKQFIGVRKVRI